MTLNYQASSPEILDFEHRAQLFGVGNARQTNYAFYDYQKSEYYIVRNEAADHQEEQAKIEFVPLELDITEVTITRPEFSQEGK